MITDAVIIKDKEAEIVCLKAENYGLQRWVGKLVAQKIVMLEALEAAKQFISNGIELGYIHLPEEGDPALETPALIDATIMKVTVKE